MIYIVGIGPGSREYILPKASKVLASSDLIVGFARAMESMEHIDKHKIIVKKLDEIINCIKENSKKDISIIASGDPGFYGITEYIKKNLDKEEFKIIPGISSFQYMMSVTRKSWSNYFLSSVHGRNEEFISIVKKEGKCVFLTDSKNSPRVLADKLYKENINCRIWVGENLSYEDENITEGTPEFIREREFSALSVFVVEVME